MKKRNGSKKVLRAMALGLATMIAVTSVPVTTFAGDGESGSTTTTTTTTSLSTTTSEPQSSNEGGNSGNEGNNTQQTITVERCLDEASNAPSEQKPDPGVSQLIDTAQDSAKTATGVDAAAGNSESSDPKTALQGYMNDAQGEIRNTINELNQFKDANKDIDEQTGKDAAAIQKALEDAAMVMYVPVQATDPVTGEPLWADEEKTVPVYEWDTDPTTGEFLFEDEEKTIPKKKLQAVPIGDFEKASNTTDTKVKDAIDNAGTANTSQDENTARKAAVNAKKDLGEAQQGLSDAKDAVDKQSKAVTKAKDDLQKKEEALDAAEEKAKEAQEKALGDAKQDSKDANDDLVKAQKEVDKLKQALNDEKLNVLMAQYKLVQDTYDLKEKAAIRTEDDTRTDEEIAQEVRDLNNTYWKHAREFTRLLVTYYTEQLDDYEEGSISFASSVIKVKDENGEEKEIVVNGGFLVEKLITGYTPSGEKYIKDGNPWQDYEPVLEDIVFPGGLDGEYGYVSDGWIFAHVDNDAQDYNNNCVVVRYKNTAGETVTKFFNCKIVAGAQWMVDEEHRDAVLDSGSLGSIIIYEREYEIDPNGDEFIPEGSKAFSKLTPQIGIDDYFVGADPTKAAFSENYSEDETTQKLVKVYDEEGKELTDVKYVADLSENGKRTDSDVDYTGNYKKDDGYTILDTEYDPEYKKGKVLQINSDGIGTKGIVDRDINNDSSDASFDKMKSDVEKLLESYKVEKGYSIHIEYETLLQKRTKYDISDLEGHKPENFQEWLKELLIEADNKLADWLDTAEYKVVVTHTSDEVDGVEEIIYKDIRQDTKSESTVPHEKVNATPGLTVKAKSSFPFVEVKVKNGRKTQLDADLETRRNALKALGYEPVDGNENKLSLKVVDGDETTITVVELGYVAGDQPNVPDLFKDAYKKYSKYLGESGLKEFVDYTITENVTEYKTVISRKVPVAVNHYSGTEYKKVYQEEIVGREALIKDKGIVWKTDKESAEKAIDKNTLIGSKKVEEYKKKYDELQQAKKDLNAAQTKAETLARHVAELEQKMKDQNWVNVDRSALSELKNTLEKEQQKLKDAEDLRDELEAKVKEAEKVVAAIDLSRFDHHEGHQAPDEDPVAEETYFGPVIPTSPVPGGIAPASDPSGVAGARTGRRSGSRGQERGVAGVRVDDGNEVKNNKPVVISEIDNSGKDQSVKNLQKVETPETPLAATPFKEDPVNPAIVGISIAALLAVLAGLYYEYNRRKKAKAEEMNKYKKN